MSLKERGVIGCLITAKKGTLFQAGSFSSVRTNRRVMLRLREALFKEHLFIGLLILTAQQRQCIVYLESPDIPLKLSGQMLDQVGVLPKNFHCFHGITFDSVLQNNFEDCIEIGLIAFEQSFNLCFLCIKCINLIKTKQVFGSKLLLPVSRHSISKSNSKSQKLQSTERKSAKSCFSHCRAIPHRAKTY